MPSEGFKLVAERTQDPRAFHPGKVETETLMQTRRKTEMGIRRAINQKAIGFIKHFRVAIRSTHKGRYGITRLDRLTVYNNIFQRHACIEGLSRRIPAKDFFQGTGDE